MAKDSIDKGCPMPKPEDLNEAAIEPDDVGFSAESFRKSWSQTMNGETLQLSALWDDDDDAIDIETLADIEAARADYAAGDYITFEEYLLQRRKPQ
jgi:hypothetical protein